MNIIIIAPIGSSFTTGIANAVRITKEILETQYNVLLIDTAANVNEKNIRILTYKRLIGFLKIFYTFLTQIKSSKIIYITISMSLFGFFRDMIFIIFSKLFLKKVFLHLHGGGYQDYFFLKRNFLLKKLIIFVLNRCDKIFILSENIKNDFNFINDKKKIKVIENTIKPNKDLIKKNFDYLRIIYLSNFIKSKGYELVLKTCKLLSERKINFKCEMYGKFINLNDQNDYAGSHQLKSEFLEFLNLNKLKDKIIFSENLDPQEKYIKLQNANVFILPSSYPAEGLPISLLEALVNKLPIISTNQGAITDIVKHDYNGFIINSFNEVEIANYLIKLNNDKKLFEMMSENSIKIYEEKFSYEQIKRKTLNEFK